MLRERRFVALVCIAFLFAIAMAPLASLPSVAVLVPLQPLFGAVESARSFSIEPHVLPGPLASTPRPSRAPPVS
jgi:hypothetical protein